MKTTGLHWIVGDAEAGVRLDKFLAAPERLGSRGKAVAALERGKIYVNEKGILPPEGGSHSFNEGILPPEGGSHSFEGGSHSFKEADIADAARRLAAGDVVRVWADRPGSAKRRPRTGPSGDLDIVYEDDALLVVNKPPGILSVPLERSPEVPSVYGQIEERLRSHGKRRPFVVHRIDQDTSGLVVFAKDPASQQQLKAQFARRQPERVYLAVVYGHPTPPAGTWRDVLVWDTKALIQKETHRSDPRGSDAIAEYRVVERFKDASLIEVRLQTGRRNQIRLQSRLRGHTLVGEQRYVFGPDALRPIPFGRQALHAYRLELEHPSDGRALSFEAPLPPDLVELLTRLRRARD